MQTLHLLLCTLCFSVLPLGCQVSDGFYCGEPLPGNDQVIQACTGANEKCDCSSRSCVVRVSKEECRSEYKYLGVPFARQSLADRCVEQDIVDNDLVPQQEDDKRCPNDDAQVEDTTDTGGGQ
ncbi:MAG: hypothetical protein IPK82_29875 [Polyangiaceae bacterium]|nr:hypothetical protein [Polyangiaceae bacterium]